MKAKLTEETPIFLVISHTDWRLGSANRTLYGFGSECASKIRVSFRSRAPLTNDSIASSRKSLGWSSSLVEDGAGLGRTPAAFEKRS